MPIISSLQVSLLSPSGKGKCGKKGKSKLPPAPFRLTDKEMKLADQRALSINFVFQLIMVGNQLQYFQVNRTRSHMTGSR